MAAFDARARTPLDDALEVLELGDALLELDRDLRVVRVNAAQERLSRTPRSASVGRIVWEVWPELLERGRALAEYRRCIETRAPVELEERDAERDAWTAISAHPTSGGGLVAFFRDVTARRRAEDALRRAEQKFAAIDAHAPVAIALVRHSDGTMVEMNREWTRLTGWSREEVVGRTAAELGLFADPAWVLGALEGWTTPGSAIQLEFEIVTRGGDRRWIAANFALVDIDGELHRVVSSHDVTDRRRSEQALRAGEQKLVGVLESMPDAFVSFDRQLRYTYVNASAERLQRVHREELLGKDVRAVYPDAESRKTIALYERVLRDEAVVTSTSFHSGFDRWVEVRAFPTPDGVSVFYKDVSAQVRAQEALRESEEQFRVLTENLQTAVSLIDARGQFAIVNGAFRRLFDIPPDADILNINSRDWAQWQVFDEQGALLDVDEHPVRKAVRTRTAVRNQLVALRSPSSPRVKWLLVSADPVLDPRGEISRVICTYYDITARKEAEQRAADRDAMLKLAMDASLALVFEWDVVRDRVVRLQSAEEALPTDGDRGRTLEEVASVVHPADREVFLGNVRAALQAADGRYGSEFRIVRPSGEVRWLQESGRMERDASGSPVRLIGISLDVTDRRRADEDLREANERLREADRRKTEFLAVLSHELRNPLAPIRNSTWLLERAPAESDRARRAREVIHRQTEHLTRLVDDLLDMTRISRGKVELQRQRVDLLEIVRKSMEDARTLFERAGIDLLMEIAPGPVWIDADPTRVAQVVGNVLHNAQKFTPAGGVVTVRLDVDGERVRVRIRDTGVGMEPGREALMFEPFAQGDQGIARTKGGLGLGLSLVKSFVEMHGGAVWARSEGAGLGTELTFVLPLAPAAAAEGLAGDAGAARARDVLVIEDSLDAAETLADVLSLDGHRVRVAKDGRSGLAAARERRPDVILCDIGLPDIDGYEVARAVRGDAALAGVRLVALTGYAQPEDRRRAAKAGFDAHVAKPPDPEALARVLRDEG